VDDQRFGFYLRPSLAMSRAQIEIHHLLERQYNLRAAGKFMPHATIKGLFKSSAPVSEMIERLDVALRRIPVFTVRNHGVHPYPNFGIAVDIHGATEDEWNPELIRLHQVALEALMPLVDPDCDRTPWEPKGPLFHAHLTLAMADVPEAYFDEIVEFVRDAEPIGPPAFAAEVVQLFAFRSDDWAGRWWDTLRWELLHSWRLPLTPER
jgi:2'-5' RNA ligase